MTISNLSTLDYYSTAISSNATNKSKQTNPLSNALSTVEEDLQSGNTTDASSVVSEILSNAPNSTSDSSSSNPASEITDYLKTLQSAISSGDTSSAEGILSKLNNYLAANAPGQGAAGANGGAASGNPLGQALSTVEEDLQSGDTTDASSVVSEILSNATNSTSDSSSSTDSTDSADSSNPASEITDYLKTLQRAISSGDTSSAESILSKLNDYLAANAAFQPTGAGTYSSDGTVTAASTTTDSALSALV
ncbi:MAG: hypothetical protein ABSG59_02850 [Verrucomicrobiota bacterium]|jgi:RNA polymerase-interacting CarD/CdnL/TRCF family regulator